MAAHMPIGQLNLPPREVTRLSGATATHGNSVAVDVCELIVMAFTRQGYSNQNAAACLDMKAAAFSKAFCDVNRKYPDQNPILKRLGQIPADVMREFASLLAEQVGLSAGIDSAKVEASQRLADAVLHVLKVSAR